MLEHDRVARALVDIGHAAAHDGREPLRRERLWKNGKPPNDFVGFAIESKPPGGDTFFPLNNRLTFAGADGEVNPIQLSTLVSPIQKFRWVHFPRNANLDGEFTYRVTPIFMDEEDRLSQGEPQEAGIELRRETYPGQLNVTFTRGFVSSQAFVDRYEKFGKINTLIPTKAKDGLTFKATHPKKDEALAWMGFEARETILELLDQAIKEKSRGPRRRLRSQRAGGRRSLREA